MASSRASTAEFAASATSMDTGWTDVAAGVTCDACRTAMRDGARDRVRAEEASTHRSAPGITAVTSG